MTTVQTDQRKLDAALRELAKLIKAVQYYPPGHPALKSAVGDVKTAFDELLKGRESFSCNVRKEGFFIGEQPIGAQNQILAKFSPYLFSRRVQSITVMRDLSGRDLSIFAQSLALDPAEVRRRGGIQAIMEQARVCSVWLNETDLSRILAEKERRESAAAADDSDTLNLAELTERESDQQISLKELLEILHREHDPERYRAILQELIPRLRQSAVPAGRMALLEGLALLCRHSGDQQRSKDVRHLARQAVLQLADPTLTDFLIDCLCDRELNEKLRQLLTRILVFIGEGTITKLMERLTREENAHNRKILLEALSRQGPRALPLLAEYLRDERWYVARNAVTIIGEIRHPEGARLLNPLLHHEDIRVCREAIRALTRIGGPGAAQALLRALQDSDEEIRRQALLSLGVIKDESAVPALVQIVRQPDFFMKKMGLRKDAVQVLGEIGSGNAVPALTWLLGHKRWFKRRQHNELRAVAAQALGEIPHADVLPALERASSDRSDLVARKASQALKQLKPVVADENGQA